MYIRDLFSCIACMFLLYPIVFDHGCTSDLHVCYRESVDIYGHSISQLVVTIPYFRNYKFIRVCSLVFRYFYNMYTCIYSKSV